MTLLKDLVDYIDTTLGTALVPKPLPESVLGGVPLYLTQSFKLRQISLFGESLYVALLKNHDQHSLRQLRQQRAALAGILGSHVVLVMPRIRSNERKRLIQEHVPFIVPGTQMYLPTLLVDLRESFPISVRSETMSWVAQLLLLRQLLLQDMADFPLSHLAKLLGYTPMAITQAVDELVALDLCDRVREGRTKRLRFPARPQSIWDAAAPRLRPPVKNVLLAQRLDVTTGAYPLHAGMTALAARTDIASTETETFAMDAEAIQEAVEDGRLEKCELEEDAVAVVETWAYAPAVLSPGPSVDPLSLYLCFRGSDDARVQQACSELLAVLE